jgi:hypothetical protein
VIFERANAPFSGVASVDASGSELPLDVELVHEVFHGLRAFVVKALYLRAEASLGELVE